MALLRFVHVGWLHFAHRAVPRTKIATVAALVDYEIGSKQKILLTGGLGYCISYVQSALFSIRMSMEWGEMEGSSILCFFSSEDDTLDEPGRGLLYSYFQSFKVECLALPWNFMDISK